MMMRQFAGADMRTRNPRILGTESAAEFIQGQWGTVWGREAGDRRDGRLHLTRALRSSRASLVDRSLADGGGGEAVKCGD